MLRKELELDPYTPKTGEPTVQLAAFHGRSGGLVIEKRAFEESHSPLYDVLKDVRPEPGIMYLLVNAVSAWETYDDNKNGDGFPEFPYRVGVVAKCGHPDCTRHTDGWIAPHEVLPKHHGSFVEHGGIYAHHKNHGGKRKDLAFGTICNALWNPRMHRVELLLRAIESKVPDITRRIADKDYPAVSMGTHVKWDVCTICGHRAPTRAHYCEHARAHLREVLPDGRKVAVLNPSPRFFDISFVFRPADPNGWTLQKVARAVVTPSALRGEELDAYDATCRRFTSIAREVHDAWHTPDSFMGKFASAAYADPAPAWTQRDVYKFAAEAQGLALSDYALSRLVAETPSFIALCGLHPEALAKTADEFRNVLRQQVFEPGVTPSLDIGPGARYRAAEPPRTDVLTVTDPFTGHVYQTTRGAAMDASTNDVKKRLLNTAIFGGLYAAGLHVGLGGALGRYAVPAGLALGYATDRNARRAPAPYRHPTYLTDQGVPVSGGTEFKAASLSPAAWAAKLAVDARRAAFAGRPMDPVSAAGHLTENAVRGDDLDLDTVAANLWRTLL